MSIDRSPKNLAHLYFSSACQAPILGASKVFLCKLYGFLEQAMKIEDMISDSHINECEIEAQGGSLSYPGSLWGSGRAMAYSPGFMVPCEYFTQSHFCPYYPSAPSQLDPRGRAVQLYWDPMGRGRDSCVG